MSSIPSQPYGSKQQQQQQQHSSTIPTGSDIPPPIIESKPTSNFELSQSNSIKPYPSVSDATTTTTTTPTVQGQGPLCYLLTWKDPIYTGKVFGSLILGLVIFKTVNLVNIFFHVAYIGLLFSAVAEYSGKLITGRGFVTNYSKRFANSSCAEKFNKEVLPSIAGFTVCFEKTIKKIVYAQDIESTLKAAAVSYILYKVTSYVTLFKLLITVIFSAFTIPFAYNNKQKEIDAFVSARTQCAKSQFQKLLAKIKKEAGPHIDNLIKKSGPVGAFVQSKIPVRTAGSTVGDSKATSYGTAADSHSTSSPSPSKPVVGAHSSGVSSGVTSSTTVPVNATKPFPTVPNTTVGGEFDDTDDFADTTQEHKPIY
ncbi:hypothetical protein KGF56_000490 [Candida oxycetoniae]|uniref:Reticulon-like protein n=1 Tax=Candida oxycetoniae TaxID=497107 RepID=A0AAI9T1I1_9ASCO|nr:uncharacterized protein KGF56_000490 [Candida oxycetoniae]KAI3406644.2 hypothetical protein KGF56_000490 [Candida oxycetoniae]